jgi:hypothetical protein
MPGLRKVVGFMFERLEAGDFNILYPDNEVSREMDEKRMASPLLFRNVSLCEWRLVKAAPVCGSEDRCHETRRSAYFLDVARIIVPKNTPLWLAVLLEDYGAQIAKERELQGGLATKSRMKRKLLKANHAAQGLVELLNDPRRWSSLRQKATLRWTLLCLSTVSAALPALSSSLLTHLPLQIEK